MQIAKLDPRDLPAAERLLSLCSGERAKRELSEYMNNENVRIYAAYDGGLAGILLTLESDVSDILDIAVDENRRRRGTGRALLDRAAAESDGKTQMLEVRASNPAVEFYKRLGFEKIAVRREYYDDPREDAIIMRREIKELSV